GLALADRGGDGLDRHLLAAQLPGGLDPCRRHYRIYPASRSVFAHSRTVNCSGGAKVTGACSCLKVAAVGPPCARTINMAAFLSRPLARTAPVAEVTVKVLVICVLPC